MNGIKMSDCKFYVDEAARTVVCVIPNTKMMVQDFIHDHFNWNDLSMYYAVCWALDEKIEMPYSFMGKATCAPEDKWDEETGRMLAFSRAKDKCYKSFFKRANKCVQTVDKRLNDMIEAFNNFGMKLENRREALQNEIESRINEKVEEE